jgi:kynurenine formamidase
MGGRPAPAAPRNALSDAVTDAVTDLATFASAIADGRLWIVDLTQTLDPDFPTIVLPPELGQSQPFRIEEISHYDQRGPAWYWNNFSMGEHTGTHFDAPAHWVTGRDLPNGTVDAIDPKKFIAPACVIDCSAEAAADPDHLLEVDRIEAWERTHGPIPAGAWALMRTDWSKRSPADYANLRDDGAHTPGPSAAAIRFLVEARGILGFGAETIGTDAGQAHHFSPPYPAHSLLHGAGRYGLQCLAHLDLLPPTGAVLIAAPLKIVRGSGSPLRVLAVAPATAR